MKRSSSISMVFVIAIFVLLLAWRLLSRRDEPLETERTRELAGTETALVTLQLELSQAEPSKPGVDTGETKATAEPAADPELLRGTAVVVDETGEEHAEEDGRFSRTAVRVSFSKPGLYRATFRPPEGYEPIPDRDVLVNAAEFTELNVQLVRER